MGENSLCVRVCGLSVRGLIDFLLVIIFLGLFFPFFRLCRFQLILYRHSGRILFHFTEELSLCVCVFVCLFVCCLFVCLFV